MHKLQERIYVKHRIIRKNPPGRAIEDCCYGELQRAWTEGERPHRIVSEKYDQ